MAKHNEFAIAAVRLPTGEIVRLATLCREDCGALEHIRLSRRGDDSLREAYEAELPRHAATLASIDGRFDAVLSPPSKHAFAEPYRAAVLARHDAVDLTLFVRRRDDETQAGADGTTVEDLVETLVCDPLPELGAVELLIVDDIFEEGKTTAALLAVLRNAGLQIRSVTVTCVLRVL